MKQNMRIRKIPLVSLIDILKEVYDRGVDFIDIYGIVEDGQDTIGISFSREYMNEEYSDNFDTIEEEQYPSKIDVKLSDEDLNQLI